MDMDSEAYRQLFDSTGVRLVGNKSPYQVSVGSAVCQGKSRKAFPDPNATCNI